MKRLLTTASFMLAGSILTLAQSLPQVHLDADGLKPRSIEELTGASIASNYALAWRDLEAALESSQAGGIGDEFVGTAKDRLVQRITEQKRTGVHVRIADRGHQVKAVFYSSDGTAMQLTDQAQLEIQILDGNKLLDTENVTHHYIVLMTPGADRWYVRDLEEVPTNVF